MTRPLAVVLAMIALFLVGLIWEHGAIGTLSFDVLIVAYFATAGYGLFVLHARHGFSWPFWVIWLVTGSAGLIPYGLWALFRFRFGRLPYKEIQR